jgi:hypothetical protein
MKAKIKIKKKRKMKRKKNKKRKDCRDLNLRINKKTNIKAQKNY